MIPYINHPSFSSRKKRLECIFGEMEGYCELLKAVRKCNSQSIASICAAPLLTKQQEQHLFLQYNAMKCEAWECKSQAMYSGRLLKKAKEIQEILVMCNMRLIVQFLKSKNLPFNLFMERFSDCCTFLIKGINCFNVFYGNKFGTYCTWILRRNFCKLLSVEAKKNQFVIFVDPSRFDPRNGTGKNSALPYLLNNSFNFRQDTRPNTQMEDQEFADYIFEKAGMEPEEIRVWSEKRIDNILNVADNETRQSANRKVRGFVNKNRELVEV